MVLVDLKNKGTIIIDTLKTLKCKYFVVIARIHILSNNNVMIIITEK